jgi:hypothetical protein
MLEIILSLKFHNYGLKFSDLLFQIVFSQSLFQQNEFKTGFSIIFLQSFVLSVA